MSELNICEIAKNAKIASKELLNVSGEVKNIALKAVYDNLEKNKDKIYGANKIDLKEAQTLVTSGEITKATYNRLKLDENKMRDMLQGILDIINLEDPVNKVFWIKELDEGLILKKISTPIGLIGVIFEARPDVISQISSLAIKSGNAVILKGGKESNNTNACIAKLINEGLNQIADFPKSVINLVFSHEDIKKMLDLNEYIDLIIPRGSNKLVKFIQSNTKIPVLGHASGICHIFIDENANKNKVNKIVLDAKTQYPSACNAVETILVHKNYANLDELKSVLKNANVEIFENPDNFSKEYGDLKISLKIVGSIEEAISHINKFGSGHTDSILTENEENAQKFMMSVDSAGVFVNTSTRFSDGFRYGFGAEVGISTNKTHARGPVGLDGLTIYKYLLIGKNNPKGEGAYIVEDYASGKKTFNHRFI